MRPQPSFMHTWPAWLVVLAILGLVAAACANEGEPAAEGDAGTDTATDGAAGEDFEERTIVVGLVTPESFPYQDGMEAFKGVVEERTEGKVAVEIHPGASLGNEQEIEESILAGSVHIGVAAAGAASFAPVFSMGELPFLFSGQDHLRAFYESDGADLFAQKIEEESGFKVLSWFTTGDSPISTVDEPIHTPEDLNGLKIRVIPNEALIDGFEALGANPTPVQFPEVYTSLQQGVIDGTHLDWLAMEAIKATEVLNYVTTPEVPVLSETRAVVTSAEWFDGLSPELQEIVIEAAAAAQERNFEVHLARQEEQIEQADEVFTEVTDIDEEAFVEVMRPVWEEWAERLDAQEILDAILEVRP